jgi:hypothetical protein
MGIKKAFSHKNAKVANLNCQKASINGYTIPITRLDRPKNSYSLLM